MHTVVHVDQGIWHSEGYADTPRFDNVAQQVKVLRKDGHVSVVTSGYGAVVIGRRSLGLRTGGESDVRMRTLASAGQAEHARLWGAELGKRGCNAEVIPLQISSEDLRGKAISNIYTRSLVFAAFELGKIILVTENPAKVPKLSNGEELAALFARFTGADELVLLASDRQDPTVLTDTQMFAVNRMSSPSHTISVTGDTYIVPMSAPDGIVQAHLGNIGMHFAAQVAPDVVN